MPLKATSSGVLAHHPHVIGQSPRMRGCARGGHDGSIEKNAGRTDFHEGRDVFAAGTRLRLLGTTFTDSSACVEGPAALQSLVEPRLRRQTRLERAGWRDSSRRHAPPSQSSEMKILGRGT
jgi:hypothetical protein